MNIGNTYTAVAQDNVGCQDTGSVTVNLPPTGSYTYDANGNLTGDGTRNFAYDDENQLVAVWKVNAWRNNFAYDGLMRRRIEKDYSWNGSSWTKTNEVHFIYDGMLVLQERDGNNLPITTYTRGVDLSGTLQGAGGIGGLLARTDNSKLILPNSPDASAYYFSDAQGNVTALVSPNGMLLAHYEYDPYGNLVSMSGPQAGANKYRFSSKEWNDNTGLYYYGYRFYDPSLQRWLNRDPLGDMGSIVYFTTALVQDDESDDASELTSDELLAAWTQVNHNLHTFTFNSPLNYYDAFGEDGCGMGPGSANPENIKVVADLEPEADGMSQAEIDQAASDRALSAKIKKGKLFGKEGNVESSCRLDPNKLRQELTSNELKRSME